jgi:hypothetical protein
LRQILPFLVFVAATGSLLQPRSNRISVLQKLSAEGAERMMLRGIGAIAHQRSEKNQRTGFGAVAHHEVKRT